MNKHQQINVARQLRRRQTDAETLLWAELRKMRTQGVRYRRQHPIGDYVVDFVCFEKKLIIEVDGGQHNVESEIVKDEHRAKWLENEGYHVIRFWNNDVLTNIEGVLSRIMEETQT
jgi:type I restriction enzyme M protein